MDSVYLYDDWYRPITSAQWDAIIIRANWLCDHWDQPDEGIWETRGGRKKFLYSQLMCWVAMERSVRLANRRGLPADLERWRKARDAIYQRIMDRGWSARLQAFAQYEGGDVLDASVLLMPLVKFIAPTDPKWLSTLDALTANLVSDSLVYRYDPMASPDGVRGEEGTFSACSFWYVEALTRAGPPGRGPAGVREDAHLRQPRRPVRRANWPDRRSARQLPAGTDAPRAYQRCVQPRPRSWLTMTT